MPFQIIFAVISVMRYMILIRPGIIQEYIQKLHEKGEPLKKRVRSIKLQSSIFPNGLISNLHGRCEKKDTTIVCFVILVYQNNYKSTQKHQMENLSAYIVIEPTPDESICKLSLTVILIDCRKNSILKSVKYKSP